MKTNDGIILMEVAIASLILCLAIITLVPLYSFCMKASSQSLRTKIAMQLSEELLEEIRLRRWDESTPLSGVSISSGSVLGINTGESASDKRTFEDIDDFNGWAETGIRDPLMNPLSDFTLYTRSVNVYYVSASSLSVVTGPTDFKQVHVCTSYPRTAAVCIDSLFTNR